MPGLTHAMDLLQELKMLSLLEPRISTIVLHHSHLGDVVLISLDLV